MKTKLLNLWNKFKTLLKQGLTPKQLALSLVISLLISYELLCGSLGWLLTANH